MHINSVVDPTVLGGMRIQVGDEVTDNTVVAQLQKLHRKVRRRRLQPDRPSQSVQHHTQAKT